MRLDAAVSIIGLFLVLLVTVGVRAEPPRLEQTRESERVSARIPAEVTGRVVDGAGSPVAGARVVRLGASGGEAQTDGAGFFRLAVTPRSDRPMSLVVEKRIGSEVLYSVERVGPLIGAEHEDLGVITLGDPCEPQWTPGLFPAPSEVNGTVRTLTVFDDGSGSGPALYAGGEFTTAGGVTVNRIAKWDGSSWSALGSGTDATVLALTVFDDGSGSGPALFAGGDFTTAGGVTVSRIAKWDGSSWSALGTGLNGSPLALTVYDDGSGGGPALYAGGWFTMAGGVTANRIAKWDGSAWSALGTGMNDWVYALAVFDDGAGSGPALYAGGSFGTAGGAAAANIAKWNGSSWSALGAGMDGTVLALTVFDDGSGGGPALYAGGEFTTAGGAPANNIARWNGGAWSTLGSGLGGSVLALTVFDDGLGGGPALYAGGGFFDLGPFIAKWNGSSWLAPSGTSGAVDALAVFDDGAGGGPALYAGGFFSSAGGVPANNLAQWNGASWSALGSSAGINNWVRALTVYDDGSGGGPALYAAGWFTTAGGVAASRIAKWDGSSWSALGSGISSTVNTLAVFDDGSGGGPALYAGGSFTTAGGVAANRIAKWNGSSWSALGSGLNSTVQTLAVFDDGAGGGPALYAGGFFTSAGAVAANRVAKWDGSAWSPLGSGTDNGIRALTGFDDGSGSGPALYAAGLFTNAGGMAANRIARWDGSSWSALDSGLNSSANSLMVFDDGSGSGPALYVGGLFSTAGAVAAVRIAKWDGSSWSALGSGLGSSSSVLAMTVYDDGTGGGPALYAAGEFTTAGGLPANSIAKWNGASWSALETGTNDAVWALTVFTDGLGGGPALFAGGDFTAAGGEASGYVARWRGCPVTATPCPGDANNDNAVDFNDITAALANWLTDYTPGTGEGDANNDGLVDFNDITEVLSNWLQPCP